MTVVVGLPLSVRMVVMDCAEVKLVAVAARRSTAVAAFALVSPSMMSELG